MKKYKALSIQQPWLYAITNCGKFIENRTWKPPDWIIGQRIALHASKAEDKNGRTQLDFLGYHVPDQLPMGCFVATAIVSGYVEEGEAIEIENVVYDCDNKWFYGPFGWVLTNVRILERPIPCRGDKGLWNIPASLLRKQS